MLYVCEVVCAVSIVLSKEKTGLVFEAAMVVSSQSSGKVRV